MGVCYGHLRPGETRHDWQDDGEEAQEVRKEVLRGGQGRADGDGTEDPGVQLLQGDVPLRLPKRVSRVRSTLSSRPRQWPPLQPMPQQQVPQLLQQLLQLQQSPSHCVNFDAGNKSVFMDTFWLPLRCKQQ